MSTQTYQFDPEAWVTSTMRSLKEYVENGLGVSGADSDPYVIQTSYPDVDDLADKVPLPKTIIHFEIDDPREIPFGIGENLVNHVVDAIGGTVEEWEAHCHEVDIDVGVWASVESGGPTARMEAMEDLNKLFTGPNAREACMIATNGVYPRALIGGRFVTDSISDVTTFRIVDMTLRVRVYSRTVIGPTPYANDAVLDPDLTIYETIHIDVP